MGMTIKPHSPLTEEERQIYIQIIRNNDEALYPLVRYWLHKKKLHSTWVDLGDYASMIWNMALDKTTKYVSKDAATRATFGYILSQLAFLGATGVIETEVPLKFLGAEELQAIYTSYEVWEWIWS